MARHETPDRELEERLRDHFAEEARELRAPRDLWERLEGRLGKQQPPPRFALLRGGAAAIGERPWIPAAAAVLVVAVGMGAWVLAAGAGGGDGNDDAPAAVAAAGVDGRGEAEATAAPSEAPSTEAPSAETPSAAATAAPERPAQTGAATATPDAGARAMPQPTPSPAAGEATPTEAASEPAATEAPDDSSTCATCSGQGDGDDDDDGPDDGAPAEAPAESPAEPPADAGSVAREGDGEMDEAADDAMDPQESEPPGPAGSSRVSPPEPDGVEPPPPPPARRQPPATTFEDYGRVSFVDTATDAVSTFSLDTDRTSYFLALAWVRDGYTVEPDSVRAEEWINAFDYEYAGPGDDSRFAITSDVLGHPLDRDRRLARIALQAPELRDDAPLNVTLVLDASGSMAWGDRVDIARAAAETIRSSLGARDRIAVVHFTDGVIDAYTVAHSVPDDEAVAWSIGRLAAHESTNVQAGLNRGVRLADEARRARPEAFNYIILMSDGVANVDATSPFAILESAADTDSANPLRLITIGVGIENYNDALLEQLAQHGNGWYRYLDTTAQARETFSRENWLRLSTPFADQARAQVSWDPAIVKAWRIVGYENRITPDHTFEQDRKEFAELPSGTATTVFYELELRNGAGPAAVLGSVEVRWVDPATGASLSQSAQLAGRTDGGFEGGDRLLRLGAIVGLAADRYSSLSPQVENAPVDYSGIHAELAALLGELDALQGQLGTTQAYRDFRSLLKRLTVDAAERAPSSGYSQ